MKKTILCALTLVTCGIFAAESDPALDAAVAKGAKFLLAKQEAHGHWTDAQMPALPALPVWALTGSRADAADAIGKGVKFILSTQKPDGGFYVPKPGRGGAGLGNYNTAVCLSSLFETKKAPTSAMLKAREYIASSQLTGDDTMAGGFG